MAAVLPSAPASARGSIAPIEHAGWCAARDAILAAAPGPATLALLGPAGAGKTWLLREVAATLRSRGVEVQSVRQGDLPFELQPGAAILVDEAGRLDDAHLAALASQQAAFVVLADLPRFAIRLDRLPVPPRIVELTSLDAVELRRFVAEWLARAERAGRVAIPDAAIGRLIARSAGTPRLAAQLLEATLAIAASAGQETIGGADIDEVADLRLCADDGPAEPAQQQPAPTPPALLRPRRPYRRAVAATAGLVALAASVLLLLSRFPSATAPAPAAISAPVAASIARSAPATVALPSEAPIAVAFAAPALAAAEPAMVAAPPGPATLASPPPAQAVPSTAVARPADPASLAAFPDPAPSTRPEHSAPTAVTAAAETAAPSPGSLTEPEVVGTAPTSPAALVAAPQPVTAPPVTATIADSERVEPVPVRLHVGGPGLILVARSTDTLQDLYAKVYRGVRPPPFAAVAAINRAHFRPGAILVFPAPSEGWPVSDPR